MHRAETLTEATPWCSALLLERSCVWMDYKMNEQRGTTQETHTRVEKRVTIYFRIELKEEKTQH